MTQGYVYDALSRETFEILVYNAVGRASEVNLYAAYALQKSSANSGWSVGYVQWDFGQPGRGSAAADMLSRYDEWAQPEQRLSVADQQSLLRRLQTPGATGNALSDQEKSRLGEFLRSDAGRKFVDELNARQLETKWDRVGARLAEIDALQELNRANPADAAKVVAMTSKLFNQNEVRGGRLVEHLEQAQSISAQGVSDWITDHGVPGLIPAARQAILTGRDAVSRGADLVSDLELGSETLARQWHEQVRARSNPSLSLGFNDSPDLQLFDTMLRAPSAGQRILEATDGGHPGRSATILPTEEARLEVSRVSLSRDAVVTVERPDGVQFTLEDGSWRSSQELRGRPDPLHDPRRVPFGPPMLFSDSALGQDFGLPIHQQCRLQVQRLEEQIGRPWDERSERLAAAATRLAIDSGLQRVDHIVLSDDNGVVRSGQNVFVVQGELKDPAHRIAHMRTDMALAISAQDSLMQAASKLQSLEQQQATDPVRKEQESQQRSTRTLI